MNSTTTGTVAGAATEGALERTMTAVVRDRYGPADVLELRAVELPEVADDEVLLRVHAAGLDRGAWHVMAGLPYLIRIAGYGLRGPKNPGFGSELAGVVETVGANVSELEPGHAVYGTSKAPSPSTRRPSRTRSRRCRRT